MADTPKADVYKDTNFIRHVMSLVGRHVSVFLCNGRVCRGVLRTFSSNLDFVLTCAQMMNGDVVTSQEETQTFPLSSVVMLSACNIKPSTAEAEGGLSKLLTDADIGLVHSKSRQRELQPFGFGEDQALEIDETLDLGGWDSEDMLNTNERKFGVQSTYSSDLKGYTTQLAKTDTEDFASRQQRATKLAREIESGDLAELHAKLDEGASEEDKYSAVVRPGESTEVPPPSEKEEQEPPLVETVTETPGSTEGGTGVTDNKDTTEAVEQGEEDPVKDTVKKSTLNPNAKSFTPAFQLPQTVPTSPSNTTPHQAVTGGGAGLSGRPRRQRGESSGSQASSPHSYGSPSVVQVISPPPQQPHGMVVPGQTTLPPSAHMQPMFQQMQPVIYLPPPGGHYPRNPGAQHGVPFVRVPNSYLPPPGAVNYMVPPHSHHQMGFAPPPPPH